MIVCDHEKAQAVLKAKGFTLGLTSVVAVEVPDTPGGLDSRPAAGFHPRH